MRSLIPACASSLSLNFVRSPQSCPSFTIPSTVSLITSPCLICLLCPSIYPPPPTYSFFKATHIPYLCHLIWALSLYVKDPISTLTRGHAVEGHWNNSRSLQDTRRSKKGENRGLIRVWIGWQPTRPGAGEVAETGRKTNSEAAVGGDRALQYNHFYSSTNWQLFSSAALV